jgi:hypothetical protein
MSSTTSGTNTFSIDVDEIIEAAADKVGGEWQTAVETAKARRALNLVLIQLANKNIPLNKLAVVTQTLVAAQQSYTFDNSYQDILTVTVSVPNTNPQAFLPIQRYGIEKFNAIPNQGQQNRPNTFTTQRLNNSLVLSLWPVPDTLGTYQARMVVAKRIQDVNASYQQVDLNTRYLPLLVQWLAYELANTRQGIDESVKSRLKGDLDNIMRDTFDEDEERADFQVKPGGISGR